MNRLSYSPTDQFELFWDQLKKQAPGEWNWLIGKFRARLIPWLSAKTHIYPSNALQTRLQFIEEVIEESLFKFYDLFESGTFSSYSDLEAMMVTICGYKLKEGYARLKKESRLYLMEADQLNYFREKYYSTEIAAQQQRQELLDLIYKNIEKLDQEDRDILSNFFSGQELRDIAADLSISAAACRKRKQRALDKLRSLVHQSLKPFPFYNGQIQQQHSANDRAIFTQPAVR